MPEQFLSKIIQFPSVSYNEKQLKDFLMYYSCEKQLYVEDFSINDSTHNFCASIYPLSSNKPNIVFLNHIDVVSEGEKTEWQEPPFAGNIVKDTIWGRGALDAKGLLAMQLFSILQWKDSAEKRELPFNVSLLSVCGEEIGGENGAQIVTNNFIKQLNAVVMFGEGGSGIDSIIPSQPNKTVFGVSVAEKSSLWLKLIVTRKTFGHGSVPPSIYANKRMLRVLIKILDDKKKWRFNKLNRAMFKKLGELEGGYKGFVIKHINWWIFQPFVAKHLNEGGDFHILIENTITVTKIGNKGIVADNQIANNAFAVLDCRLLPEMSPEKFLKKIKRIAGRNAEIEIIDQSPSALPSPITKHYEAFCESLEQNNNNATTSPILFPATTDNNFFRNKGIPVYGCMPIKLSKKMMESIHNTNEHLPVKDLHKGIKVYSDYLDRMMKM
ncbi:MAG: M20/M25/M40 family metallo-hydrolase [Bacteroidota bacterium]